MKQEQSQDVVAKVLKVEDLAHMLSIGRNTAYELVRSGKIRSIMIGLIQKINSGSGQRQMARIFCF